MYRSAPLLLALLTALLCASPTPSTRAAEPLQDSTGIARGGAGAEVDLARWLLSGARVHAAIGGLERFLAEQPAEAERLAGRELERMRFALELREAHLAKLAADKERLRIRIDGKRRALRVTGYADGVLTFARNKYDIEDFDADEIPMEDLTDSYKNHKAGQAETRAYLLALVGDKTWKSQWPFDEEGHEQLVADLQDVSASVARGERVELLRAMEVYLGQLLDADDGHALVALFERAFGKGPPKLEDDPDERRMRSLRELMRAGLEASFGAKELGEVLHASSFEVRGEELILGYDFEDERQLEDWLPDEDERDRLTMLGILKTPVEEHVRELDNGYLQFLGTHQVRHVLPFRGPIRLRYSLRVVDPGTPGGLWQILVFLNDDLERNYMAVSGLAYALEVLQLGRSRSVEREQRPYTVAKDYFVEVTVDAKGLLTGRREDLDDEADVLSLPSRRVDHGVVRLGTHTDYLTGFGEIVIQARPDLKELYTFRTEWVHRRMSELGF